MQTKSNLLILFNKKTNHYSINEIIFPHYYKQTSSYSSVNIDSKKHHLTLIFLPLINPGQSFLYRQIEVEMAHMFSSFTLWLDQDEKAWLG